MPYTTPPTFADDAILSAAQLNILSDDIEYLFGLIGGLNLPFNSLTATDTDLRITNNSWLLKHLQQYLHHRARVISGNNDDFDIFLKHSAGDILIYTDSTTRGGEYLYTGGAIDLEDLTTWLTGASGDDDIYQGAWLTATSYEDYDIVLETSNYYICPSGQAHTSGTFATDLGAGKWVDLGTSVNLWTTGNYYQIYVYTNRSGSMQFTVDYLLESDQSTI